MNRNWALIVGLGILMSACTNLKKLPEGAPSPVKTDDLFSRLESNFVQYNTLMLSGDGELKDPKSQSFRFKVRMIRDSVIWLDITDPIIGGIKVARAIIYPDSIAFINNLSNSYLTGKINVLQQSLGLDFGFGELQALFSSKLVFPPDEDHELYYRPGYYVLANFPIEKKDSSEIKPQPVFNQILINPQFYLSSQRKSVPSSGKNYRVDYEEFKEVQNSNFPQKIRVTFTQNTSKVLELKVKDVDVNRKVNIPFSIPKGYARIL